MNIVKFVALAVALTSSAGSTFAAELLFEGKFTPTLSGWQTKGIGKNDGALAEVKPFGGEKNVLVLTKNLAHKGGTAIELMGERFKVTPGERISVIARTATNLYNPDTFKDLRFVSGYMRSYVNGLQWYGEDGELLKAPWGFGYETAPNMKWSWTVAATVVPAQAHFARVSIGFDNPNLTTNDVVAIASFKVYANPAGDPSKRVTLRDDGMTLVGGKPFFPIGIYAVHKCPQNGQDLDRGIRELKEIGFNTLHRTGVPPKSADDEFLRLSDKYGMKVFAAPADRGSDTTSDNFVMHSRIEDQNRFGTVLAWYLADDTASHVGPEVVSLRHRICKALDPDRLTLQADGVMMGKANCRYDWFVHSTDVFLPELYPCYEKTPVGYEVAEVVREMRASMSAIANAGRPVKSVWPIIQHFDGWGWQRFPTAAELKAMTWAGIINGGNGVIWYVYHSASGRGRGIVEPEHWAEIAPITRELASLHDELTLRDAPVQPKVEIIAGPKYDYYGNEPVTARLKVNGFLMMVNASTNAVSTRVTSADYSARHDFAPYEVKLIHQ